MSDNQDLCTMSIADLIAEYNSLDWACMSDSVKDEDIRRMQNRQADIMAEAERRDELKGDGNAVGKSEKHEHREGGVRPNDT